MHGEVRPATRMTVAISAVVVLLLAAAGLHLGAYLREAARRAEVDFRAAEDGKPPVYATRCGTVEDGESTIYRGRNYTLTRFHEIIPLGDGPDFGILMSARLSWSTPANMLYQDEELAWSIKRWSLRAAGLNAGGSEAEAPN